MKLINSSKLALWVNRTCAWISKLGNNIIIMSGSTAEGELPPARSKEAQKIESCIKQKSISIVLHACGHRIS